MRSFVSSWSWRSRLGQRCRWSQWIPFKTWKTRRFFGGHILEVPCHILVASPRNWVRLIYTILLETFKSLELELRRMFFSPFLGITWGSPSLIYFDEKNPQEWDTQQLFGTIQWFENPVNGYIWSIEWFNHTFERLPGISRDGPHLDPFIFFGPTYVWFQPISRGNPIVCPTILVQLFLERAGQLPGNYSAPPLCIRTSTKVYGKDIQNRPLKWMILIIVDHIETVTI